MNICCLCCTHGRYRCLQRAYKAFLDQDYKEAHLLFICNSGKSLRLETTGYKGEGVGKVAYRGLYKGIYIYNLDPSSYTSVGEKYSMALKEMERVFPNMVDVVVSFDDDDYCLPNHLTEGAKGIDRAYQQGQLAYKPQFSYYRSREGMIRNENTYEPSIFVDAKYLKETGYAPVNIKYHQQWLDPLVKNKQILVDPNGPSTFIYNWGDPWDTYKMSGSGDDGPMNLIGSKRLSVDMGEGSLIPNQSNQSYYDEIKNIK